MNDESLNKEPSYKFAEPISELFQLQADIKSTICLLQVEAVNICQDDVNIDKIKEHSVESAKRFVEKWGINLANKH